jgi:hypothetical protein
MQEEEARKIANESASLRLRHLVLSGTGALLVLLSLLVTLSGAYLSGYNENPRVIIFKEEADELRTTLKVAADNIKGAVTETGFANLPEDAQRKLVLAIKHIESVSNRLEPKEDDNPVIFLPNIRDLFSGGFITPAYAQEDPARTIAKEDFRQNLAMGILIAISVFWVVCLIVYFWSKDEKKIAFAATMIQTVLGFYIGVFTGLL